MPNHILKFTAAFSQALIVSAALGLSFAPTTGISADQPAKTQQPSAKLQKPLHDAQEDIKNKKYSDAIAKLKAAEQIQGKTPYDQHLINQFLAYCYIRTQNYAEAAKPAEAQLDDGFTPQAEIPGLMREVIGLNYQIKDYDKVIEIGNRAMKAGYADEQTKTLIGQSYYLKGDWKGTLKFEEGVVDTEIKEGKTPKNDSLLLLYSACQKLNDVKCENSALEKLIAYYPKPEYWQQLLYQIRQETSGNEGNLLETYRLMNEVDIIKEAADYTEFAELAIDAGSTGEAQAILEKGFARNVFTDKRNIERNQRLLDRAKKQAASDQATLPKLEKEADAATTGQKNYGVGLGYYGYGQYDKAVDQLSKAVAKGGVKNDAEAHLLLGISQFKAGHKDDASKSFKAVKGDPTLERLANLWNLHMHEGAAKTASAGKSTTKKSSKSTKVAKG
ncbi:MAG TPA: hypothetical protein VED02_01960 [Methyloceanibacter sp.]|nr:hypothetical protein [Methyloceanibacter sp.]